MLALHKKMAGTFALLLLFCFLGFPFPAPAEWQRPLQPPMSGGALTCLASHPFDSSKFLISSGQQVFEAGQAGTWRPLWSQGDVSAPIQRLLSFDVLPDTVFVITNRSVFMGNLKDLSWHRIYKGSERTPLAFSVHPSDPNHWFLGTQKGLLETPDAGKTWSPSSVFRVSGPVPLLAFDHERLFLADEKTLYLAVSDSSARPVLDLSGTSVESAFEADENPGAPEEALSYELKIRDLIVSKRNSQELFLATTHGVFRSRDSGYRWEPLPQSGLQSVSVLQLAYSEKKDCLYAATPRGVYAYGSGERRWTSLFQGLAKDRAQGIAVLNEEKLIAITGEGFVQYPLGIFTPEAGPALEIYQPPEEMLALFKELISREPSAREVHKRVVRYADVGNGKIKRWQAESRLAALLPNLSFSKSFSRNASIDLDRGSTSDPDRYIIGPEDSSRGGYKTLSWSFGDMLYSSAQTSIDSREKLMVELRNDLLSEATRIYYERRRLQIDIIFTPPSSGQEHLENLLRMDELSALLDGMTDGFFSERLERIYGERPAFNGLWAYQPAAEDRNSGLVPRDSQQSNSQTT